MCVKGIFYSHSTIVIFAGHLDVQCMNSVFRYELIESKAKKSKGKEAENTVNAQAINDEEDLWSISLFTFYSDQEKIIQNCMVQVFPVDLIVIVIVIHSSNKMYH